jgi:hypothetical protein
MLYVILYSGPRQGTGSYKRVAEPRLFLSQLMVFKEVISPVKKQKEQEAGQTIHYPFYILPPKICCALSLQTTSLVQTEVA